MEEISQEEHAQALAEEDPGPKSSQFKGIRKRKWGSWVSEIRIPRSRDKLWLGSYKTAEQAARAYDAAVYYLRGPNAIFNFPNSVPSIPSAPSLSRHEIQLAASRYATLDQLPAISPAEHNNNENASANDNKAREDSASLSQSALVQETMSLMNGQHQQEHELLSGENLLAGSGDCLANISERLAPIDEALGLKLIQIPSPCWAEQHHEQPEEEDINHFLAVTDLWNFGDV